MIFSLNRIGEGPKLFVLETFSAGFTLAQYFLAWPIMWALLYFKEGTEGVSFLWNSMFEGTVLAFIGCNLILFFKVWIWFFFGIITWIFSFIA